MEDVKIKRMRTINESLKLIKELDPNSSITYNAIKVLCLENKIPSIKVGNRIILNFDSLITYLNI